MLNRIINIHDPPAPMVAPPLLIWNLSSINKDNLNQFSKTKWQFNLAFYFLQIQPIAYGKFFLYNNLFRNRYTKYILKNNCPFFQYKFLTHSSITPNTPLSLPEYLRHKKIMCCRMIGCRWLVFSATIGLLGSDE